MVGDKQIGEVLVVYFKQIFTFTSPSSFEQILQGIDTKVSPLMNAELTREYTAHEVERALKQIKPLTEPGLDGMFPIFFKSCWNFIDKDVIDASLTILNLGSMPNSLNHTFISLITKTKLPEKAKDFCPISLCNVLYKIVSKTIANHLKNYSPI